MSYTISRKQAFVLFTLFFASMLILSASASVKSVDIQEDWNNGEFFSTSVDRNDNSGILGIGYLNGTNPQQNSINDDNLTAHWRLDREVSGTGGAVKDYSGNELNGTYKGGIDTSASGVFSTTAVDFSGSGESAEIDTNMNLTGDTPHTLSLWYKGTGGGGALVSVNYDSTNSNKGVDIWDNGDGEIAHHMISSWSGDAIKTNTDSASAGFTDPFDDNWHHIVVTYNGSKLAEGVEFYIDGEKQPTSIDTDTLTSDDISSDYNPVRIGGRSDDTGSLDSAATGKVDEFRIYNNESLSEQEIEKLYFNGLDGNFNGSYTSEGIQNSNNHSWNDLEVNTSLNNQDAYAKFQAQNGTGAVLENQTFKLNEGLNNYSLGVNDSKDARVKFNFSSGNASETVEINSYSIYNTLLYEEPNNTLVSPADSSVVHSPVNFSFKPKCYSASGCSSAELYFNSSSTVNRTWSTDSETEWKEGTLTNLTVNSTDYLKLERNLQDITSTGVYSPNLSFNGSKTDYYTDADPTGGFDDPPVSTGSTSPEPPYSSNWTYEESDQFYFDNADDYTVGADEYIVTWYRPVSGAKSNEVMLQANAPGDDWDNRIQWGGSSCIHGSDGSTCNIYNSNNPATAGEWNALVAHCSDFTSSICGTTINGLAFTIDDGKAYWDSGIYSTDPAVDQGTKESGTYDSKTFDAGKPVYWKRSNLSKIEPDGSDLNISYAENSSGTWEYYDSFPTNNQSRYFKFNMSLSGDGLASSSVDFAYNVYNDTVYGFMPWKSTGSVQNDTQNDIEYDFSGYDFPKTIKWNIELQQSDTQKVFADSNRTLTVLDENPPNFFNVQDSSGGEVKGGNPVETSVLWKEQSRLGKSRLRVNRSFERDYSTGTFQTPISTGRINVTDIGFKPEIIEFRVSGTISEMNKDVEEGTNSGDQTFSWSHGFAMENETGIEQNAMTVAGNSNSQDGHTAGARDDASIYLHVQDGGSYTATKASTEELYTDNNGTIEMNFEQICGSGCPLSRYNNFTVHYTAYRFGDEVKANIGSFDDPENTGTQQINTGFRPNYVRTVSSPAIGSINSDRGTTAEQENTFGWSHGTAVKNETGIEQLVASVSGNGYNINGHAYAANDSEIIRNLYTDANGVIQGRDRASLSSFTSNGFELDWKNTYSGTYAAVPNSTTTYLAISLIGEKPDIGHFRTPGSASNVTVDTGFEPGLVKFTSSNTIDDIDTEGQQGSNIQDGTFGWMHGTATNSTDEDVQMYATHSDSVNGHAMTQFDNQSVRMLYTDNNGVIQGKDYGHIRDVNSSGFQMEFQNVYSGTYKPFVQVPVIYTAFPGTERGYVNTSTKSFGGATEGWANLSIQTYEGESGQVCWNQWANDTGGLWQTSMTDQCFNVLQEPILEADGSFESSTIFEQGSTQYNGVCRETGGENTVDAESVTMTLQENSTGTWNDVTGSGSIRANKTSYSLGTVENGTSEARAYSIIADNPGDYYFRTKCGSSNAPIDNSPGKILEVKEAYGTLDVSLDKPSTLGTNRKEFHREFWLNGSVSCEGPTPAAECGDVNSTAFYGKGITDTWFNSSWKYRKKVEIQNEGTEESDYQHRIELNLSEEYVQGKIGPSCNDIRTTYYNSSAGEEQEIPHWTESCNVTGGGNVTLWTKIPELEASSTTESYVYYGNLGISSGSNISEIATSEILVGEVEVPADAGWTEISMNKVFDDPAVIATSTSENSLESPKIAQVNNVSTNSFDVRMCEHDTGCDTHPEENISYMVFETDKVDSLPGVEAGTVTLSGGDAGSASTVNYQETFSTTPDIIAQAQNTSRAPPAIIQGVNADTSSADLYTCQHDGGDGCNSVTETEVDWIAIEPGNVPFASFETGTASGIADSAWTSQSFSTGFSAPPVVTAMIQTNSGGQQAKPSMARSITSSSMEVRYCEHESGDTCDSHNTEDVSWFASETKTYSQKDYSVGVEKQGSFAINDSDDTPFYTTSSQPQQCGSLSFGESCQVSWRVNSTGNVFEQWKLFPSFTSSYKQVEKNVTSPATVEISDFTAPEWSNLDTANSTPLPGDDVKFSAYWEDNYELDQWKLNWNASGSFENKTSGTLSGNQGWSNITVEIPAGSKGDTIDYRFYGSDTSSNFNLTDRKKVYVGSPPDNTDPVINQVNITPDKNGYDRDFTINANITDNIAVYNAKANITTPEGDVVEKPLTKIKDDTWQANFSDWERGTYSFYVWANDTGANIVDTSGSPKTFEVQADTSFYLETSNESYPANTDVELTSAALNWWDYSFDYRKTVQVTENSDQDLENYPVNISLDTASLISQGKMQNDCGDLRPVDSSTGKLLDYWIKSGCNTQDTEVFIELNLSAGSTKKINLYYGNSNAGSLSDRNETMKLLEVGETQVDSSGKRLGFSKDVSDPVVIASPPSENDVESGTGRVDGVNATGFNITFQEEPDQDGTHPQETFFYMVAPKGSYELTSGEVIQASSYSTDTECIGEGTCNWDSKTYYSDFADTPIVLAQLQSSNNDSFAYTTQKEVTSSGFDTAIGKAATTGGHGTEEIGWIAVEPGTGTTSDGTSFESTITPNTITGHDDGWSTVNFQNSYTSPLMVSTMQTWNGADGGWLRRNALNSGSVEMHVDEDQVSDPEQGHTDEVAGMFVVEKEGTYPMRKYLASEPSGTVGEEEKAASHITNTGSSNTSGKLLIQVQRNSTGEVLYTAVNDTEAGKTREIDSGEIFEIGSIYNSFVWNSGSYEKGYYKIVAYLTDPGTQILKNSDGSNMVGETVFYLDVTPPEYDSLSVNDTSPRPEDNVKFSANWSDDGELDRWELYWNESGFFNKVDSASFTGSWSNSTVQIPQSAELKDVGYYFEAYDSKGNVNQTEIRTFSVEDVTPPSIDNEAVDSSIVDRGEQVNITAEITDNDELSSEWIEIGVPGQNLQNHSLGETSTDLYYRNFSSSIRGEHNATIYANDTYGNTGKSSLLAWDVYGYANVSLTGPTQESFDVGSQVELSCKVRDNSTGAAVEDYPVDFYRDSTRIGGNTTNSSGSATYSWDTSGLAGSYDVNCRIDDNATLFYNADVNHSITQITVEVPEIVFNSTNHENSQLYGLDEYDAGDVVDSVNAEVENEGGAPAGDVKVTLEVTDEEGSRVPWFDIREGKCGTVLEGETCTTYFESETTSSNILINPSFEFGNGLNASNWTQETTSGTLTDSVERSSEISYDGGNSIKQVDVTDSYSRKFVSDEVNVVPGQDYSFGGRYYLNSTSESPDNYTYSVRMMWFNSTGGLIDEQPFAGSSFNSFDTWEKVNFTEQAPVNAATAELKVRSRYDLSVPTSVYWDGMFVEGPESVKADASANTTEISQGETVELDASGTLTGDSTVTSYEWDVDGDGNYEKTGQTTTHKYTSSGSYDVKLNVTDSNGISDTDTLELNVTSVSNILVNPSVETGDGLNATNWTQETYYGGLSGSVERVNSLSFDGSYSIRQVDITSSYSRKFVSDPVDVVSGQEYSFGGYYHLNSTADNPGDYTHYVEIQWLDDTGSIIGTPPSSGSTFNSFDTWEKVNHTFTAPADAESAQLKIRSRYDATTSTDVYWDQMFIEGPEKLEKVNEGVGTGFSESIPEEVSGDYEFRYSVDWDAGGSPPTTTKENFTVHDIKENTSAVIDPQKVVYGDNSTYNFTVTNPWSTSISSLNISLQCGNASIGCESSTGSEPYKYVGTLNSGQTVTANFTLDSQTSTPAANYDINTTMEYSNPGEQKQYEGVRNKIFKVRPPTPLDVNLSTPETASRGNIYEFTGKVTNTETADLSDVWLNYTIPSQWSIQSGNHNKSTATLTAGSSFWSNITVSIPEGSELKEYDVRLESDSLNENEDFEINRVQVLSNTSLNATINETDVLRNQTVRISSDLQRENSTLLEGEQVEFRLGGELLGTRITDSSGHAELETKVPASLSLGSQTLNVSYSGSDSLRTLGSFNTSTVTVDDEIIIDVSAPEKTGYGKDIDLEADIGSLVSIERVNTTLKYPNGSKAEKELALENGNYTASFTDLWKNGTYSFSIRANNTEGFTKSTPVRYVDLEVNATPVINIEDTYGPNENVYLEGRHWWNSSWDYRKKFEINSSLDVEEHQISREVDTASLYSEGEIGNTCSSFRATYYNSTAGTEQEIPHYTQNCSTSGDTEVWFKVPEIKKAEDEEIYLYYGNDEAPEKSDIEETFSYSEPRPIGYIVSDQIVNNGLSVYSMCDNNSVEVAGNSYYLNKTDSVTVNSGLSKGTSVKASCLVQAQGTGTTDDAIVPVSWAGQKFIYGGMRDPDDRFCFTAPYGEANVKIYDGGVEEQSLTVTTSTCVTNDITSGNSVRIQSDEKVLASYYGSGGDDSYPMRPASSEAWYGVPSSGAYVAAGTMGATIDYSSSSGTSSSTSIGAGSEFNIGGTDNGAGDAYRANSSGAPIGVIQQADSDGTESSTWNTESEMTTEFGAPFSTQYISIAAPYAGTTCSVYDSTGSLVQSQSASGTNGVYKIGFGTGNSNTFVSGAWTANCTDPVWPYYEDSNDEETNLLGWKQMRHSAPDLQIRSEAEELSRVENSGSTFFESFISMTVETNRTGTWEKETTVINETSAREIKSSFDLASLWNSGPWNTGDRSNGTFRIVTELQGENSEVLGNYSGYLNDTETFRLESKTVNMTFIKAQGTNLDLYSSEGELLASDTDSLFSAVKPAELYDLKLTTPTSGKDQITEVNDLNVTDDIEIRSQVEEGYSGEEPRGTDVVTPVYAQEDIPLNKTNTTLYLPKNGASPNSILHCKDWNFSSSNCRNWEVDRTSKYDFRETPNYMIFNVSGFDAYGGGDSSTLPNITKISVYDITDAADEETGGELVDSGLNETLDGFNITQSAETKTYRFDFRIENDGLLSWTPEDQDELFYEGLNSTWNFDRAWYNISNDYDGGTFSGGKVSWDTSQGGTLQPGEVMHAKFIINISESQRSQYDMKFKVNDTSDLSGSSDIHDMNVVKLGDLQATLETPPEGSNVDVCNKQELEVKASIECQDGYCGEVNGSTRYNQSSSPDTLIPEGSGRPFHINGTNTKLVNSSLWKQKDTTTWNITVDTDSGESYKIDANFSSEFNKVASSDTGNVVIGTEETLQVKLLQSRIDFGVLDPGVEDKAAALNSKGYNISIKSCGSKTDLYTKSTNLTTTGWGKDRYKVWAQNISYSLQNDPFFENQMDSSYQLIKDSIPSGTNVTTFYWVDVPKGIKSSEYNGTISYKIDTTG